MFQELPPKVQGSISVTYADFAKPLSISDCRKCNRRRIKCDRTLPGCGKCSSRSIECPGYGIALKWDQGVASRGYLKGASLYKREGDPEHAIRNRSDALPNSFTATDGFPIVLLPGKVQKTLNQEFEAVASNNQPLKLYLVTYSIPVPEALRTPTIRRLIYHYDQFLAPQLAWVDSYENPWRNIILPMLLESPSLLSSILASSAGDLAKRNYTGTEAYQENLRYYKHYQDRTLGLLAEQMKHDTLLTMDQQAVNNILAAIFLLCYHEMKLPESGLWLIHLRAARSILTSFVVSGYESDLTRTFLLQEFYSINAISDITSFASRSSSISSYKIDPPSDGKAIFMEFLRIIHSITRAQRQTSFRPSMTPNLDLEIIRSRLAKAMSEARKSSQAISILSTQARQDFESILEIFYYSTLVYAYQTFGSKIDPTLVTAASTKLFLYLRAVHDIQPFAQDIAWPVFLLGTASADPTRVEERRCVEERMEEIMRINGPLDRLKMMKFLKDWWGMERDVENRINWFDFARKRAKQGEAFLVF